MKIIQILISPDTPGWQGALLGLGDNNIVYMESRGPEGHIWKPYFEPCKYCDGVGTFPAEKIDGTRFTATCNCRTKNVKELVSS